MKPVIKNSSDNKNPILSFEDGVPNYVMLYIEDLPGESSQHHTHPWEHEAYIVKGSGILWVEGVEYDIKQGDAVLVPPNSEHHFTNTGSETLGRVTVNPLSSVGH